MKHPLILLLCLLIPRAALGQVTITRTDPAVERKTFDPLNRPADMPKLSPNESAITQSFFGADTRVGGEVVERKQVNGEYEARIKVDMVRMTLQLRATIWLPRGNNPKLAKHEEGHRILAEHFYKNADAIARELAQELIGQTITGRGPDPESAGNNALKDAAQALGSKYLAKTDAPAGAAQEHYDRITAHGTNAVSEDRAIAESIKSANADPTVVQIRPPLTSRTRPTAPPEGLSP